MPRQLIQSEYFFSVLTITDKPAVSIEDLDTLDPIPMCTQPLLLLSEPNVPSIVTSTEILSSYPFLWPSVLTWAIVVSDNRAQPFLALKAPNVGFINDLFYHASVCVAQRPSPWLLLLDRPDYRLLRRFCPDSIQGIHFFLASDIASPGPAMKIIFGWRAWISAFGLEEFIRALLYVVMWHIQVGADPISVLSSFRSAGCVMVIVWMS